MNVHDFDSYSMTDDELIAQTSELIDSCHEEANEVSDGMTPYQIERFVLGKIPPVGRYHQCCLEIRRRLHTMQQVHQNFRDLTSKSNSDKCVSLLSEIESQRDMLRGLANEVAAFKRLADKYRPLAGGRAFHDESLQEEYWDQMLGWKLALSYLGTGVSSDLIASIMSLHDGSYTKKFVQQVMLDRKNGDSHPQIEERVTAFIEDYRCAENVKRPQLSTG